MCHSLATFMEVYTEKHFILPIMIVMHSFEPCATIKETCLAFSKCILLCILHRIKTNFYVATSNNEIVSGLYITRFGLWRFRGKISLLMHHFDPYFPERVKVLNRVCNTLSRFTMLINLSIQAKPMLFETSWPLRHVSISLLE